MLKFYREATALTAFLCAWPLSAAAQTNWLTNEENKITQDATQGSITSGQASSLQQRAAMIQAQEQQAMARNGGTLTPQEKARFDRELRGLNQGINGTAYRDANPNLPYNNPGANGWQNGSSPWQNGMAPGQAGYVPPQNGYIPSPNGTLPAQYQPQFNHNWQYQNGAPNPNWSNQNGTTNPNWNNGQQQQGQGNGQYHHHHHHNGQWNPNNVNNSTGTAGTSTGQPFSNYFNHQ